MINGRLIRLARELRELSLAETASRTSLSATSLCRSELNERDLTEEEVEELACALHVPAGFFSSAYLPRGATGEVHFRRKASTLVGARRRAVAEMNLAAFLGHSLQELLGTTVADRKIEAGEVGDYLDSPEVAAGAIRRLLGIPPGPVYNLVQSVEDAGVYVFAFDLGQDISGLSTWSKEGIPVICVNSRSSGDRQRWTVSHELGHLALHTKDADPQEMEREADVFASELLMPKAEISTELRGLSLQKLMHLKLEWSVSMSSLVMQARALGRITEHQARTFFMTFSKRGWRKREPVEVPNERPTLASSLYKKAVEILGSTGSVAARLHISTADLEHLIPDLENPKSLRLVR